MSRDDLAARAWADARARKRPDPGRDRDTARQRRAELLAAYRQRADNNHHTEEKP